MPDANQRYQFWKKMIPADWLEEDNETFLQQAAEYKLSGGSMVNIIQACAIKLYENKDKKLTSRYLNKLLAADRKKREK